MNKKYIVESNFSANTFMDFAHVLCKIRRKYYKYALLLFAIFFIFNSFFGLILYKSPQELVIGIIGLVLLIYLKRREKNLAKSMLKNSQGNFDENRIIRYEFNDNNYKINDLELITNYNYQDLYDLVETDANLYLFTKKRTAFIINKSQIENSEELIGFISLKAQQNFKYVK